MSALIERKSGDRRSIPVEAVTAASLSAARKGHAARAGWTSARSRCTGHARAGRRQRQAGARAGRRGRQHALGALAGRPARCRWAPTISPTKA
jgi:hypothetical protein